MPDSWELQQGLRPCVQDFAQFARNMQGMKTEIFQDNRGAARLTGCKKKEVTKQIFITKSHMRLWESEIES